MITIEGRANGVTDAAPSQVEPSPDVNRRAVAIRNSLLAAAALASILLHVLVSVDAFGLTEPNSSPAETEFILHGIDRSGNPEPSALTDAIDPKEEG